ncbi:hypothetical protein BRARA_A02307 [Brassica rapa]|uniref:Uncharacterized protein n=2 Tax=Brassica TaxID=3705 RepID=A0A398AVC7_BRACM|nr:hypothetical protein BRARA_A02307 [Brassica rapa]CAF2151784.1 unnamed protein product [Brassica napus]
MTRLAAWVTVKEKRHGQRSCWEQQDTDHASSKRIKPVNRCTEALMLDQPSHQVKTCDTREDSIL